MADRKQEEPTFEVVARFDGTEKDFTLEQMLEWLKQENYDKVSTRTGPGQATEVLVYAKPTEIRLAYSKELYKRQQENNPQKALRYHP